MLGYLQREVFRILSRCVNSYDGLVVAWREEASFSQWVTANGANILAACLVELSPAERALIIACGLLVLVAELLNTGIEAAIDRVSSETHPLSAKAKDASCAAVTLMAIITVLAWLVILIG